MTNDRFIPQGAGVIVWAALSFLISIISISAGVILQSLILAIAVYAALCAAMIFCVVVYSAFTEAATSPPRWQR